MAVTSARGAAFNSCRSNRLVTRALAAAICALLSAACAGPVKESAVSIESMVIENQTRAWISSARVLAPTTGRFVSCGNIAPGSMCYTSFPEATYAGNPVEITWSQAGEVHATGEFQMDIPEGLAIERPAMVRVVITGPGSAGAVIVQPGPGRNVR